MRKKLQLVGFFVLILIVSLTSIAAAPDKTGKLKVDEQDYDMEAGQLIIQMSCKFGVATAGEHANFMVRTELTIKAGADSYDLAGERNITKAEGATKDADNFIAIEPITVLWDSQGFTGYADVATRVSLVGPNGNIQGAPVIQVSTVKIEAPSTTQECPECGEEIPLEYSECPECGAEL